jgi:CBS domain-containing protein/sporulation protein YlmC with PRC-barrel domain
VSTESRPQPEQHFLSDLLGTKVTTPEGAILGKTQDLVVNLDQAEPEVMRLVFRKRFSSERRSVPWSDVRGIHADRILLASDVSEPAPPTTAPSEILLRRFLLDKQIVDTHGAKIERVNDLQFLRSNGRLILVQVDVGLRGLLRRLGFERHVVSFLEWFFDYTLKHRLISWSFAQPLADPDRLKLQISQRRLASLHPADLADIIEEMDVHERAAVAESMKEEVLAEALEEMDPKVQVSIVRGLDEDKAADIIEEMPPDEAADLIADLPEEKVLGIFREMDQDYAQKVRQLLVHEEDEAGGLMSTRFLALPPDSTIVDALAHIKQNARKIDVIYYIYVVNEESGLLGVVNLKELLSTEIFTPLESIMTTRLITVKIDEEAEDLAGLFAKYGFRAIPVVDEQNRIQGVIRFKALLEILAPYLGR